MNEIIYYPEIWGPHYWFFLNTIAMIYPDYPNKNIQKKYYELIINFPLFIPIPNLSKQFSELLDKYPVTPYLDSKESLIKWIIFIHNKINIILNKKTVNYNEFIKNYTEQFKDPKIKNINKKIKKKYIIYFLIILILLTLSSIIYNYKN